MCHMLSGHIGDRLSLYKCACSIKLSCAFGAVVCPSVSSCPCRDLRCFQDVQGMLQFLGTCHGSPAAMSYSRVRGCGFDSRLPWLCSGGGEFKRIRVPCFHSMLKSPGWWKLMESPPQRCQPYNPPCFFGTLKPTF